MARPDVQDAQARLARGGVKRELEVIEEVLNGSETVLDLAVLNTNPFGGKLLIVSSERLVFLQASRSDRKEHSVPLREVRHVERTGGKMIPKIAMFTDARYEFAFMSGKEADRVADVLGDHLSGLGIDTSQAPDDPRSRVAGGGANAEVSAVNEILDPSEVVLELAPLSANPFGSKLLVATTERLLFLTGHRPTPQAPSPPMSDIRYVERGGGKLLPKIVFFAPERLEVVATSGKDADRLVDSVRRHLTTLGVDASTPPDDIPTAGRPDIQSAIARMTSKIGGRRELRRLPDMLQQDETVLEVITGSYGHNQSNIGLLVLTDSRLLFYFDGLVNQQSEDFPLSIVSSVTASSGLANATVRITSGGHHTEIHHCLPPDAKRLADAARTAIARVRSEQATPTQTAPPVADIASQLRQLAELKDAGILTQEEFSAKKQELLSRM